MSPEALVRIVHLVKHLDSRAAGVAAFVRSLAACQQRAGHPVVCCAWEPDVVPRWRKAGAWVQGSRRYWNAISNADVVHIHGLWSECSWFGGELALAHRKPYVVSPHGMLDPWALAHSRHKKRIAWTLLERGILARAKCIHALCEAERRATATVLPKTPSALIAPGLEPRAFEPVRGSEPGRRRPYVLFLGRLHPKKGIDLLIEAFASVAAERPGVDLVIAGPDEAGIRTALESRVGELRLSERVFFVGPVSGERKAALIAGAGLFALTSHSEGVPIAVLEAMAAGVPVLVSPACNLPEVAASGAGRLVELSVLAIAAALREQLALPAEAQRAMGTRACGLAQTRFNSERMALEFDALYAWAIGAGAPPAALLARPDGS